MLVKGHWELFDDGEIRPTVHARVQLADGTWKVVALLLDAGADRTILEARLLPLFASLTLPDEQAPQLGGVGGRTECKLVQTRLVFLRDDSKQVTINGPFAVFTERESSDISILGRDVTNNFDVIYSFPQQEVLLLAKPHHYVVQLPF